MMADRRKILMLEVGLKGRYAVKVIESGAFAHSNHYLEPALAEFNLTIGASSAAAARAHLASAGEFPRSRSTPRHSPP